MSKRILKDPNLSKLASDKFKENIEETYFNKMLKKGCVITDILEKYDEREIEDKEIEMKNNFDKRKMFT